MAGSTSWYNSDVARDVAVAVPAVALATAISVGFETQLGTSPQASALLCAIMFVAWARGISAAVLAAVLATMSLSYMVFKPAHSFQADFAAVVRIAFFGAAAAFVVLLSAAYRRAEQALRLSEAKLVTAIDTIPVLIASYGPDGRRDFANAAWRSYTGLSQEQVLGTEQFSTMHPDDIPGGETMWRAALRTGTPLHVEQRIRAADGTYRWFVVDRVPLRDEDGRVIKWLASGYDIEDQKRAETALQRSEAYLAEAQKITLTGSFGWSLTTNSIYWSDQAYKIMGYERTAVPSMDLILARIHPDDAARVRGEIGRVLQGGHTLDFEHRLVMPDGEIKYLRVVGHRVQYVTGQEEMVGALVDITAATRGHEALQAAQAELAHANRVTTLGEISASIAHEVNQPLAAIVSNAQACLRFLRRDTPDLDDVRGTIERIVSDANRASDVILHVRALMDKSEPELLPLDVNALVREVAVLLERELTARRVSLRLELIAGAPTVIADRIQLQQVVINLMMNGIEAMQATDRCELTIRSYEGDDGQIVIAVCDNGVGFGDENPDRLFQAFFSTKPDGLGIGLSICRSIIEGHGGRIWALANEGPGASFQFALPLHRESRPAATERIAAVH